MNVYRVALQQALEESRLGRVSAALSSIDVVLEAALEEGSKSWASLLVLNAGLLCERLGSFSQAREYYDRYLAVFGDDEKMFFSLARAYKADGNNSSMLYYRHLSRQAALRADNTHLLEVLDQWDLNDL